MFSRDGRYLYGSSYYTGVSNIFRYEVATGEVEAVSNAETGFFRPVPLADGRLLVLTYTGRVSFPRSSTRARSRTSSAITFLGAEVAAKYPVVKTWQVPPAEHRRLRKAGHRQRARTSRCRISRSTTPTRCCRATRTRPGSATTSTSRTRSVRRRSGHHRRVHADRRPARQRARPRGHHRSLPGLAGEPVVEPLGFLRPVRSDQAQPQGLCREAGLRRTG